MYIQEQEEMDYQIGAASELQNALSISRMEQPPDDSEDINLLANLGRFVVIMESTTYCRRTDAILGSRKVILGDFATKEEAERHYGESVLGENEEVSIYIVPPPAPKPEPQLTDAEIPF